MSVIFSFFLSHVPKKSTSFPSIINVVFSISVALSLLFTYAISFSLFSGNCGFTISSLATFLIQTSRIAIVLWWMDTVFVTWLGGAGLHNYVGYLKERGGEGFEFTIETMFLVCHLTKNVCIAHGWIASKKRPIIITITIISNLSGKKLGQERWNNRPNYLSPISDTMAGVCVEWRTCPLPNFFFWGGGEEGDGSGV